MLHPNRIGDRSQLAVMTALIDAGYVVLTPFGEHRYDLVAEKNNTFIRIQVKTARYRSGCIIWSAYSTNGSTSVSRRYTVNEIDAYGVYCPDIQTCYLVPIGDVGIKGRLRIDSTKNNQVAKVRKAEGYILPVV